MEPTSHDQITLTMPVQRAMEEIHARCAIGASADLLEHLTAAIRAQPGNENMAVEVVPIESTPPTSLRLEIIKREEVHVLVVELSPAPVGGGTEVRFTLTGPGGGLLRSAASALTGRPSTEDALRDDLLALKRRAEARISLAPVPDAGSAAQR